MNVDGQEIRILLVEDEENLAHAIKKQLEHKGYFVEISYEGGDVGERVVQKEYHLIILDIILPKKSGFDILQELRSDKITTPVLILTCLADAKDRIKGLNLGADDYLVKPFDSGELMARIEAILRRTGFGHISILQAGDLVMDVSKRSVYRGVKKIKLSDKEFLMLEFFLRNKNQIITRKRLSEQVWGYTFDTGTNLVDVYICYLRDAIDEGFPVKLFKTIRGEGYILKDDQLTNI